MRNLTVAGEGEIFKKISKIPTILRAGAGGFFGKITRFVKWRII
jgi:hypothetical protein